MTKPAKPAGAARKAPARAKGGKPSVKTDARAKLFVVEYLKDLNATQAAIRAGYKPKSARTIASRLLTKDDIAQEIAAAMRSRMEQAKTDAEWLLTRLRAEADADIAQLYDDAGKLKPVPDWPLLFRQGLVAGLDVEELFEGSGKEREQVGIVTKIRFTDRTGLKGLIGKHTDVRAFERRVTHKLDSDAITEFARMVQGRSIRPVVPGGGK